MSQAMYAEFITRARSSRERARAACEFTNRCRERAAILLRGAEKLLTRFDALERRILLRSVTRTQSVRAKAVVRPHESGQCV